jgi:hypothetical protein
LSPRPGWPSAGVGLEDEPGVVSVFEDIDYREPSSRSTSKREGIPAVAGDFEAPAALPIDGNGENVMPWRYLVPTQLPGPKSADLPIVYEDLVATEPVTPAGRNTTDDDEGHVRIIGPSARGIRRHTRQQQRAVLRGVRIRRVVRRQRRPVRRDLGGLRRRRPYTSRMSDESSKPTDGGFARWWLGGFGCVGAIVAGALAAVWGSWGFLSSLELAVLGGIVGLLVGLGIGEALALIADGLGWDDKPQTSRAGRLARRMDQGDRSGRSVIALTTCEFASSQVRRIRPTISLDGAEEADLHQHQDRQERTHGPRSEARYPYAA